MNTSELAREVGLPIPTVHRLVTGKSTRPYPSSLKPIADFFSLEVEQLLGEKPLSDNNETDQQVTTNSPINGHISHIPLVPWSNFCYEKHSDQSEKIPYIGPISREAFATIMPDTSMEPMFTKNSILIFDPKKEIKDRSYVLIRLKGNQFIFRQILSDAEDKYLKALNSDLKELQMRMLTDNDQIMGVLVESRTNFKE